MAPMHVQNAREVPEYEIDPTELDFSNSVDITKVRLMSHIMGKGPILWGSQWFLFCFKRSDSSTR